MVLQGILPERASKLMKNLNVEYFRYLEDNSPEEAYSKMVETNPYRMLANATYDWDETPLDGNNNDEACQYTDVSNII